jgi:NTP pyrophosphatase (non-canonical NTP hydrolase)
MPTFDEYQLAAGETAVYPGSGDAGFDGINYCAVGLGNEAGEVLGKWKKFLRDDVGEDTPGQGRTEQILDEVGDVLWYAANLCSELGYSLESVAQNNLDKLLDRKERGVLQGSGDTR